MDICNFIVQIVQKMHTWLILSYLSISPGILNNMNPQITSEKHLSKDLS